MVVANDLPLVAVVPPDLALLPALFLPDLETASLRGRLAAWSARERACGRSAEVVLADGSETASELARRLAHAGPCHALVCHAARGATAALVLADALAAAGIGRVDRLASVDGTLPPLPEARVPLAASAAVAERAASCLVIVDEESALELDPRQPCGAVFRRSSPARLERLSPGACAGIGAGIDAIEIGSPSEVGERCLLALPWPATAESAVEIAVAQLGRERVRLAGDVDLDPADEQRLRALVARCFPDQIDWLDTVLGLRSIGVDALAEMFAGNGLVDRNRDLMSNL